MAFPNEIFWFDLDGGNDGDDGLSDTTPKKTISGANWWTKAKTPGDVCIIRRGTSEIFPGVHAYCTGNGHWQNGPITTMGTPRPDRAITGDFTQGSTQVDNVDIALVRESHQGRRITTPDGESNIIEWITDGNTLILADPYCGATDTTVAATIQKDELYDWYSALGGGDGYSGAWDADADTLPQLIPSGNFLIGSNGYVHIFYNFEIPGGVNGFTSGMLYMAGWANNAIGILISASKTTATMLSLQGAGSTASRINITGAGSGTGDGVLLFSTGHVFRDSQINNMGDNGLFSSNSPRAFIENINIGQVQACGIDIEVGNANFIGRNIKYDKSKISNISIGHFSFLNQSIEHFDETHQRYQNAYMGTIISNDGAGADVNLRSGGAELLHEIFFNTASGFGGYNNEFDTSNFAQGVIIHEDILEMPAGSQTFRYYVQSTKILTARELWLEVDYTKVYVDNDTHLNGRVISSNAFTVRADADDWGEFLEVTIVSALENSKVYLRIFAMFYSATDKVYVDPQLCDENGTALVLSTVWAYGKPIGQQRFSSGGGGGGMLVHPGMNGGING